MLRTEISNPMKAAPKINPSSEANGAFLRYVSAIAQYATIRYRIDAITIRALTWSICNR
jgi:hypothetical protein